MIVKNIYLVSGIRCYGAYQGDPCEERVKLIIPATDENDAKTAAMKTHKIDEISDVRLLYEVVEGCGWGKNGVWEVVEGIDNEIIYSL